MAEVLRPLIYCQQLPSSRTVVQFSRQKQAARVRNRPLLLGIRLPVWLQLREHGTNAPRRCIRIQDVSSTRLRVSKYWCLRKRLLQSQECLSVLFSPYPIAVFRSQIRQRLHQLAEVIYEASIITA